MRKIWSNLIRSIQPPRVVTIIGGGGKTSLMYYLLTMLKDMGYNAVGTTTTKLSSKQLSGNCFVQIPSVEGGYKAIEEAKDIQDHVTLVSGEDSKVPGKMVGIPGEWIDQLATIYRDVVFVVEGDGSAGKPLKGHLEHEPVIPSSSSLVIPVIGIDSMRVQLNLQSTHRPERICELTGAIFDSLVTTEIITKLLFHPQGYLRNCGEHNVIVPFINKVESVIEHQQAEELAQQILTSKHPQVGGVIVGSLIQEEGLWLQV
ncbi:MAG: hypothetical protein H6Q68_861 [Firmicutes bacterium]|nr:hypothetical protein [Bacillota bacterium]